MISLCMIVKNEAKFIKNCLEIASNYVDEIIIVDTGSTDNTLDIVKDFNCKVSYFEWCNDFSKARNFSISKASYDWILILDADEFIDVIDFEKIKEFTQEKNNKKIGQILQKSLVSSKEDMRNVWIDRLFNKNYFVFQREIHEKLCPLFDTIKLEQIELPLEVMHYGYSVQEERHEQKNKNYLNLLINSINKNFDGYLVKHLASCYLNLQQYDDCIMQADRIINNKSLHTSFYFNEAVTTKLKALFAQQQYSKALELSQYFDLCKENLEYLYFMGSTTLQLQDYETSLDLFQYIANQETDSDLKTKSIVTVAEIFFTFGNYESALHYYSLLDKTDDVLNKIEICKKNIK